MASSLKALALMPAPSVAPALSMKTLGSLKYVLMDTSCMGTNNLPVWNRGELGGKEHRIEFTPCKLQRQVFHGGYASFFSEFLSIPCSHCASCRQRRPSRALVNRNRCTSLVDADCLPIVSTVVQDGLEEGFVMIMIRLGFQEHTIDVDG